MKKYYILCFILSWIISNIMCVYVTYKWVSYDNIINSAPKSVNLFYAVPFFIVIIILIIIGVSNYKKLH